MTISKLFDSGFLKRNNSHFASIVKVAMSDGVINKAEKSFLDRLAQRLDIGEEEYKSILKDYNSFDVDPPMSYNTRLERLFDLARMVRADEIEEPNEISLLQKLCIALGFKPDNVKSIANKALSLVYYEVELDEFIDKMKNINS